MPAHTLPRARLTPAAAGADRHVWAQLLAVLVLWALCSGAVAQCGLLPMNEPLNAGAGNLNLNGSNVVNQVSVTGSLGNSVTMAGQRVSTARQFPALVDVSASSSTTHINNLTVAAGGSYTFSPGDYLINGGSIGSAATLVVQAGARLYLQGTLSLGSGVIFNGAGPTEIGQIFLYPNANLSLGAGSYFRGVIYGPGSGNNINLGSGSSIVGAVVVNGSVASAGITLSLSGVDQAALAAISTCTDTTAPTVIGASMVCGNPSQAVVSFSEQVRSAAAQTSVNYSIPGVSVTAATLASDLRSVTLSLGSAVTSTQSLDIKNVSDLAGNPMQSSSVALNPATLYPGLYGQYYSQNGLRDGYGTYAFTGNVATRVDGDLTYEWLDAAPGVGSTPADGFSVRWTGVVKINSSGSHGFATASDDGIRLWVNKALLIDNFSNHAYTVDTGAARPSFTAGSYVPVQVDFYEDTGYATAQLAWQEPGQSGSTYYFIPAANLYNCSASGHQLSGFRVAASTTASTCAPQTITVTALDTDGLSAYSGYTGTITLTSSSGRGSWAKGSTPAPGGTLVDMGNGSATYTFVAADAGVAKFTLSHSLAQKLSVSASQGSYSGSSSAIEFRDNAFVFAEDLNNKIAGTDVAVAGRPHDLTLSLVKKDPSTGVCSVATDYSGSRALKFWRSDAVSGYAAPTVVSPPLSIPVAQPAANNLTLSFTNGVASFNLGTTDIGRYSLHALDDSLSDAATSVSGASGTLTVRPFTVVIMFIKYGATQNPNGSAATDAVLAPAGGNLSVTSSAYTWNSAMLTNGADPNNTGTPPASAADTALKAGNRITSFAMDVTLKALAGSQTPSTGVLGTLSNHVILGSSFVNGQAAVTNFQYSEVGSFALDTSGVVSNFLGSGLSLDGVVTNSAGNQNTRIGRFVPAGFALSNGSVTHRSSSACSPASAFTYLGETFSLGYTLTAVNVQGATTSNYTGAFAKLDLATPANLNLAGLDGSTVFATNISPARLTLGTSSGSWVNGVASNASITAVAERGSIADGPFTASFGIAPVDSDGVTMSSYNLDVTSPTGNDHATVTTVPLRLGRLRLQNAVGTSTRPLALPLSAQYFDGRGWADNTLDSCTGIPATVVSFGNLRKSLTTSDTTLASNSTLTLASGKSSLVLAAPAAGRVGTVDVALSLGATATNAACLQPWTPGPGDAATMGAGLAYLRGAWCGASMDKDPSARASFGLFKGADNLIYQRENY